MWPFGDGVDHDHYCVKPMRVWEFHDEVDADSLPAALGYRERVEQADQSASEDLVLEAGLASSGVLSDMLQDLWPPVVAGDQL